MRITGHPLGYAVSMVAVLAAINPSTVQAQPLLGHVSGGPVFVQAIGNRDYAWQVGAGVEKGSGVLSVAAGADYVYFTEVHKIFDGGRGSSMMPAVGMPAITVNGSYYPNRAERDHRMQPFVVFGMMFVVAREAPPLPTVGFGVNWWTTRKAGFRIEVREELPIFAIRCGVVFR